MHITRNVAYGLVASLLLFTVAIAVQRASFSPAPEAGEDLVRPSSRTASRPVGRVAGSPLAEDDASIDAAATGDSDRPAARRSPATWRNADAAPDRTVAATSLTSPGDPAASHPQARTWFSPLAALARVFSPGGGGTAGGPETVAPNAASASPTLPQSGGGPVREVFFADREEAACQPGPREFLMDDLRGVYVCIVWAGLSGTYTTQLTFLSPDGHVYQTKTLAFVTPEAPQTAATVEVGGRQYPVRRAGWGRQGETLVVATLPVAGTYITKHNLAGGWALKISLDGQPVDEDQFVLRPKQ